MFCEIIIAKSIVSMQKFSFSINANNLERWRSMKKKQMSEQDIRSKFITPALVGSDWDLQPQITTTYHEFDVSAFHFVK